MTDTTLETRRRLEEGIVGSFGGRMRHWGQLALANPLAFVATCTLSAVVAFGYSYVPLHAVKDRKLVRLGSTVIEQEIAISELESEIENLRLLAARTKDVNDVAVVASDRGKAKREIDSGRRKLAKANKRAKRLERERNEWKGRVASLEAQLADSSVLQLVDGVDEPMPTDEFTTAATVGAETRAVAVAVPPSGSTAEPIPASPAP